MRIVGGRHKGLALAGPKSGAIRPTTDRTREALFNILTHGMAGDVLTGARVLDLFAGTGALGLEALSRGADFALFVDEANAARGLIRTNIERLGHTGHTSHTGMTGVLRRDATRLGMAGELPPFDLVFCDPPYGKGLGEKAIKAAADGGWLTGGALVILEEDAGIMVTPGPDFEQVDRRDYGDTGITFLRYAG